MHCYTYDKKTKVFTGTRERQLDPIEKKYLMPANGTVTEPPKYDVEKEIVKWDNDKWFVLTNPAYDKKRLLEKNSDGLNTCHIVNGKVTKKSKATLKKEVDAGAITKIKKEALFRLEVYKQELIIKILGNMGMIEEMDYFLKLKELSENEIADLTSFSWPEEPK